jgi:hypothetical protein
MYLPFARVRGDLVYGGTERADTYRVKPVHATSPSHGRQRRFPEKTGEKYMKSLQIALSEDILVRQLDALDESHLKRVV